MPWPCRADRHVKIRLPKELMDRQARNTTEEDGMDFASVPVFPTRPKEGERAASPFACGRGRAKSRRWKRYW